MKTRTQRGIDIDLEALKKICHDYLDYVDSEDYSEDNDFSEYIFETAMQTFYGENVFDWINNRQE